MANEDRQTQAFLGLENQMQVTATQTLVKISSLPKTASKSRFSTGSLADSG
jgi:hypothetical protein